MARLERIQAPPQFTLGFTELEWLGYKAWYREGVARGQLVPEAMEQQDAAQCSTMQNAAKRGPMRQHRARRVGQSVSQWGDHTALYTAPDNLIIHLDFCACIHYVAQNNHRHRTVSCTFHSILF